MIKNNIYIDGGCRGDSGLGGSATQIWHPYVGWIDLSGCDFDTTRQKMQLTAAIRGLRFLKVPDHVRLYSNYAHLIDCMNEGWYLEWEQNGWKTAEGEVIEDRDLWESLTQLDRAHKSIEWIKAKSHPGLLSRERRDKLIRQASRKANRKG